MTSFSSSLRNRSTNIDYKLNILYKRKRHLEILPKNRVGMLLNSSCNEVQRTTRRNAEFLPEI